MISKSAIALGALMQFINISTKNGQKEMGASTGMAQSTISAMEHGKALTLKNLEKYAGYYGVSQSLLWKTAEEFLAIYEHDENKILYLACYIIGTMQSAGDEMTATNLMKRITNYHDGVLVGNESVPGLFRDLASIGRMLSSYA